MFPNKCKNCGCDDISGPHIVTSNLGKPWIIIENPKLLPLDDKVQVDTYICMGCKQVKFFAKIDDFEESKDKLQDQVVN